MATDCGSASWKHFSLSGCQLITSKAGRLQGQSWHELVMTAYMLQTLKRSTIDDAACLPATAAWQELWKAGVYNFDLVLGLSNFCSCCERSASVFYECTMERWCYAGNMVHLDFHLCESEYRSRLLATRTGASFELRLNNIKGLLDAVYFFWYQERDLARGAKFLAKVVSCSLPKVMMLL